MRMPRDASNDKRMSPRNNREREYVSRGRSRSRERSRHDSHRYKDVSKHYYTSPKRSHRSRYERNHYESRGRYRSPSRSYSRTPPPPPRLKSSRSSRSRSRSKSRSRSRSRIHSHSDKHARSHNKYKSHSSSKHKIEKHDKRRRSRSTSSRRNSENRRSKETPERNCKNETFHSNDETVGCDNRKEPTVSSTEKDILNQNVSDNEKNNKKYENKRDDNYDTWTSDDNSKGGYLDEPLDKEQIHKEMEEKLRSVLAKEGKVYPPPKPEASHPIFANDGSFLETFKRIQQVVQQQSQQYENESKARAPICKRRGGKILKTGIVTKSKPANSHNINDPDDVWSVYLREVKNYQNTSCDVDTKTRPLVK